MIEAFNSVWKLQVKAKESYGDFDWSFTKFESKAIDRFGKEEDTPIRAIFMENHVTCSPQTRFLVIMEDGIFKKIHVRVVGDKYRGHDSPKTLAWYKKRKFSLDYVEPLHLTPLGGSYGDSRDNGYVLTAETFLRPWEVDRASMGGFDIFTGSVLPYFVLAVEQLKEDAGE
jgi:hypothetical protein